MKVSENSGFVGASWEPYSTSKALTISDNEGSKTLYVKYRDYADYEGSVLSATTILDTSGPTGSIETNGGAVATKSRAVVLTLSATDSLSTVTHMKIAENAAFTGASWEAFSASKPLTLSTGDGTKTVYVKYKDAAGNESEAYSDTIMLDTLKPSITITNIGLLSGIPDSATLYYSFTSQTPYIQGRTEKNSKVYFVFNGNSFSTTANANGWYGLVVATLPNGFVQLKYYAVDQADNKSDERILKLMIKTESVSQTQEEEDLVGTEDEIQPVLTEDVPVSVELFAIAVTDNNASPLINTIVLIDGQQYITDSKGNIYIEQKPNAEMDIQVEVQGRKVKGTVQGEKIIAEIQSSPRNTVSALWWFGIAGAVILALLFWLRKRNSR